MLQPIQQQATTRTVIITCFTCGKDVPVTLRPWQTDRDIICPLCSGKQAIIRSSL